MSYIETLGNAVGEPLTNITMSFIAVLPKVFVTAVVILFGYIFGWILGKAVEHLMRKLKIGAKFKELKIAKPMQKVRVSKLVGWIVKWYTFVIFFAAGANYISLYPVTNIITRFAEWFPKLMIALVIGLAGAMAAEWVYEMIMHVHVTGVKVLAGIAKVFILVLVAILALDQVIDVSVLENAMLILFGGLSLGIAVALGVSFGLALKDDARQWIDTFKHQDQPDNQ